MSVGDSVIKYIDKELKLSDNTYMWENKKYASMLGNKE